ncbi:MAG: hypothetical protein WEB87_03785 [Bacteriovoracaceae bacterium]
MFHYACIALLALSSSLYAQNAQNIKWADLVESRTYKIDREIELTYNKSSMIIKANEELKLLEFRPLPMINVFLAEFKTLSCSDFSFSSEMILLEVAQDTGPSVSVGVDMAKNCVLEVFIEKKDYNAVSIFR